MSDDQSVPKTCRRCRRVLPLSEFPLRRKDGTRRHGHCRDCKAAYQRQWYERNKDRHIANVAAANSRIRAANRTLVRRLKDRPCADCGGRFPPHVMDFDHVRGRKRGDIARMKMQTSTEALLREIAKCDVVCANCHRIRTHQRRQS